MQKSLRTTDVDKHHWHERKCHYIRFVFPREFHKCSAALISAGTVGHFRSLCCAGGEPVAAPRAYLSLAACTYPFNAEHEAGQAAYHISSLRYDRLGIEPSLPAIVLQLARSGVSKLRPAGQIRPTKLFYPAAKTFFVNNEIFVDWAEYHIQKRSHHVRCPALELLCNSLCCPNKKVWRTLH